ncbi:MAG: alpha/beta hydrolase [Pseudomonadota bacterium]
MTDPLTFHHQFSREDIDAQYDLRAGRPDYDVTVIPGWMEDSAKARTDLDCQIDLRYGAGPKQKLDVFTCGDPGAPTLFYIHGGYWQRGDKSVYSFLAVPFVAAGANVVVVGYDLCPTVSITQISAELREAVAFAWRNASQLGLNADRFTVMGHSAGGHLTQMMMATDWPSHSDDLPADLIKAGIPVSPLSYLEPVRLSVLNDGLRMDAAEADAQSPITHHPPVTSAPQLVVVGGRETDEFKRQSQMYVDAFATAERTVDMYVVPDVDHFDELNVLADPSSPFFQKTCALLGLTGA